MTSLKAKVLGEIGVMMVLTLVLAAVVSRRAWMRSGARRASSPIV